MTYEFRSWEQVTILLLLGAQSMPETSCSCCTKEEQQVTKIFLTVVNNHNNNTSRVNLIDSANEGSNIASNIRVISNYVQQLTKEAPSNATDLQT